MFESLLRGYQEVPFECYGGSEMRLSKRNRKDIFRGRSDRPGV